jgi:hypothetical protein
MRVARTSLSERVGRVEDDRPTRECWFTYVVTSALNSRFMHVAHPPLLQISRYIMQPLLMGTIMLLTVGVGCDCSVHYGQRQCSTASPATRSKQSARKGFQVMDAEEAAATLANVTKVRCKCRNCRGQTWVSRRTSAKHMRSIGRDPRLRANVDVSFHLLRIPQSAHHCLHVI